MRMLPAVAAAMLALAPAASAQTVEFVDNPAIVDPHPMAFESWTRISDDRAVELHFTTGTPTCYGVHATATETPDTVTVALHGGTLPEAVGRACIMIAVAGSLDVPLQNPLGDREVVSAY